MPSKQKTIPVSHKLEEQFKICVSGAAAGDTLKQDADLAYELGRQIALQGVILLTGATTGLPFFAAQGNYECGGLAIGFSPAATLREHINGYKLPVAYHDVIVYTGFNYAGRNLLLTRAADAVITIGGRMGTLNEFTIAFEDRKVCGVLAGSGGIADEIPHLLHTAKKDISSVIIYESDPKRIVERVITALQEARRRDPQYHKLREVVRSNKKAKADTAARVRRFSQQAPVI